MKFLWMNLPDEPQFVISYKLIPEGEIPERLLTIMGSFSYAEDNESKTIDIIEDTIELD